MRNYWSCSDFANWLRGTMKPEAETGKGWREWRTQAKQSHPFRYWLAEEGLDLIQDTILWIPDKIYAAKYYINNRWVTKTHALTAHPRDIKPGTWRDVGNRFLPCMFNELVDFVEIEQAWHHIAWDKEARDKFQAPWWAYGWFRWRTWRCPEAGLAYLDWASKLTFGEDWGLDADDPRFGEFTPQALAAQETLALYKWWKEVYPNRPDPMDISGWSAYCDTKRAKTGDILADMDDETPEEKTSSRQILDNLHEIEARYEQEDEEMMIRLIKINKHLWT